MDAIQPYLKPSTLLAAAATLYSAHTLYQLADAYFLSPMRDVPTPFFAFLFPWVPLIVGVRGKAFKLSKQGHDEYGPVYRVQPDLVLVCDPRLAQQILARDNEPKSKFYDLIRRVRGEPENILTTRSHEFHRKARRLVAPGFTIQYLRNLEGPMAAAVGVLEQKLRDAARDGGGSAVVDIGKLFHLLAADIIGDAAFGESLGMVRGGDHPYLEALRSILTFSVAKVVFPFLPNPPSVAAALQTEKEFLAMVLADRRALNARGGRREDVLQAILDVRDPDTGAPMSDEDVETNAKLFMGAGSETTANTMGWTVYFLVRNPAVLARLRGELDAAFPDLNGAMPLAEIKKVAYLDACVKEAQRLRPVVPQVTRELAEDRAVEGVGNDGRPYAYTLPRGTTVQVSILTMHTSDKIWLRPLDYWPERWLLHGGGPDADDGDLPSSSSAPEAPGYGRPVPVNLSAFVPFSAGPRACLGRHFAWGEMRTALARLVRRFDLEAAPGYEGDKEGFEFVTLGAGEVGVRVRPREK